MDRARNTVNECKRALLLFEERDETARRLGAKIVITLGRSITFALQRMRNDEPRFRDWYAPYEAELKRDPLFVYFKNKRNAIEHEADDVRMTHLTIYTFYDPAPGAIDAVMSDGSAIKCVEIDFISNRRYARVITPSGREEERDIVMRTDKPWWVNPEVRSFFLDAPVEVTGVTMVDNCIRYITYLDRMVSDAEAFFGKG